MAFFQVIGSPEFDLEFDNLAKQANAGDFESSQLLKRIQNGIEKLKLNYRYGEHINHKRIPGEYIEKYGVKNLWKLDISSSWRLIYTVRGDQVEVISIVLEVISHKNYERKFGYSRS